MLVVFDIVPAVPSAVIVVLSFWLPRTPVSVIPDVETLGIFPVTVPVRRGMEVFQQLRRQVSSPVGNLPTENKTNAPNKYNPHVCMFVRPNKKNYILLALSGPFLVFVKYSDKITTSLEYIPRRQFLAYVNQTCWATPSYADAIPSYTCHCYICAKPILQHPRSRANAPNRYTLFGTRNKRIDTSYVRWKGVVASGSIFAGYLRV